MSCQDTCVVMEYDGSTDFYTERTHQARKPHQCCECGDPIPVGATYERVSGKTDGDFWSASTCAPCAEIRRTFACGGWIIGELWEAIQDQLFREWDAMKQIDCLARLTTDAAIAKMRTRYAWYRDEDEPPAGRVVEVPNG